MTVRELITELSNLPDDVLDLQVLVASTLQNNQCPLESRGIIPMEGRGDDDYFLICGGDEPEGMQEARDLLVHIEEALNRLTDPAHAKEAVERLTAVQRWTSKVARL